MAHVPSLMLGASLPLDLSQSPKPHHLPAHHLVTHGVIVGMTGSGKTGLITVLVEEALRTKVPVLMIDVKGDLPNLLLAFPSLAPEFVLPWVEAAMVPGDERDPTEVARLAAETRRERLAAWN